MLDAVLFRRSLIALLVVVVLFHGVATLRCYTCENARDNDACNKDGPTDCEPTMDTCQTIVDYSAVSEKLSINKICTMNTSCGLQVNETSSLCVNGMTSSRTSACTFCCSEDACNVSRAARTCQRPQTTSTSLLLAGFVVFVVIRAAHLLDDTAPPDC